MRDFNRIKEWLLPKLKALDLSVEEFARDCRLSRSVMYFYLQDRARPSEQTMAKMCHRLGVPLEEGLRQYTPRKVGRPAGYKPVLRPVRPRIR